MGLKYDCSTLTNHLLVSLSPFLPVVPPGLLDGEGSPALLAQQEQLLAQVRHIGYHHLLIR